MEQDELIRKSDMFLSQGQPEKARALLEKALASFPESPALHVKLAEVYFETYSEKEKSAKELIISHYEKALAVQPDNSDYLSRLGYICYWFGEYDRGEERCRKAIEVDKRNVSAWITIALINLYHRHDDEKTEEAAWKIIELLPDKAAGYESLGGLYSKIGKVEEAMHSYLKGLEAEPDNLHTWYMLFHLFEGPDYRAIMEDIAGMAISASREDTLTIEECAYKGEFYTYLQLYSEAENLYRRCLERIERRTFSRHMLQWKLEDIERKKEEASSPKNMALAQNWKKLRAIWNEWCRNHGS